MPMEIFVVARVGLATLGGVRIALDLSLSSTLGYFYPSACEILEGERFTPDVGLRSGRVRVPELSRERQVARGDAAVDTYAAGA